MIKKHNKKGDLEELVKTTFWIIFFVILLAGVSYLIKNLTGI